MTVDILIEDDRWAKAGLEALAARAVDAALTGAGLDPEDWDVSLLACDDARIAALNADFRGKPQPTNVLSWPSEERAPDSPGEAPEAPDPEGDLELGDIAIAFETCRREADEADKPFENHVIHLIVHGTLHLLGYDHETDQDAALMEKLEVGILAELGLPDPY